MALLLNIAPSNIELSHNNNTGIITYVTYSNEFESAVALNATLANPGFESALVVDTAVLGVSADPTVYAIVTASVGTSTIDDVDSATSTIEATLANSFTVSVTGKSK